jgi:hypothetical protein
VKEDVNMPLRDHFRPPLDDLTSWEQFHGQWPAMIVLALGRILPPRYVAGPNVHAGAYVEIDVAAFEIERWPAPFYEAGGSNGGVATAVWAPSEPTLTMQTDLPDMDAYEVRVFDTKRGRRLVAAIEIVSPANKDRPEHRRAFVSKCVALLQNLVSVTILDLVTTRNSNLYHEILEAIGQSPPSAEAETTSLYAAACRGTKKQDKWQIETWYHNLALGKPLPTLPLWLADNFAIPLELEPCYEETCRVLRIP